MMVDRLDKIERNLGMAGTEPERCEKCGRYLIEAYTSGETHCPYCLQKELSAIPDFLRGEPESPNPHVGTGIPIRVRVAKALGKETLRVGGVWYTPKMLDDGFEIVHIFCDREYVPILDYDEHVDLAMGALEEYLIKLERDFDKSDGGTDISQARIDCFIIPGHKIYFVYIGDKNHRVESSSEAEAICEAIAKHAEQL